MKGIARFIGRIFRDVRNKGLLEAFKYYLYALTPRDFIVFSIDPGLSPDYDLNVQGVIFRKISLPELKAYRDRTEGLPQEFYCDILYGFRVAYVAEIDGALAAIHWLVMPGDWSNFMVLGEGDAELNYNTVLPQYRGKRLAEKLMSYIVKNLKEEGRVKRIYGVISSANIAQFKQTLSIGFIPVGVLTKFFWTNKKYSAQTKKAG